ncbi:MAG: hypothetical protein WDZ93_00505 [Candidatus Paceibacterota bacterium]
MKKASLWLALLSILFAVLPIASVITAGVLASVFGCGLSEGDASTCTTPLGDIGELLYFMAVFGWFVFFTIPIGLIGLLIAVILFIVGLVAGRRKAPQTPPQS